MVAMKRQYLLKSPNGMRRACRPTDGLNVVQLIYLPVTIEMMHLASIMPLRQVVVSMMAVLCAKKQQQQWYTFKL